MKHHEASYSSGHSILDTYTSIFRSIGVQNGMAEAVAYWEGTIEDLKGWHEGLGLVRFEVKMIG